MSDSEAPASLDIHPAAVESEPVKSGSPAHKDDEDEVNFEFVRKVDTKKLLLYHKKFKLIMIMPIQ
jgi:hypothetical protein